MKPLSVHVTSGKSAANNVPADLEGASNFQDRYLQPLRIFDSIIRTLAEVHSYAKLALSVLSWATKIILTQADCDTAILDLLQKLGDVYGFITEDKRLHQISSMHTILGQISQQILECAYFIRDYSETKNFWSRAGKNIGWETDDAVRGYGGMLDKLMDNFQKQVTRDVAIYVHRTGETLDLSGMTYADGAGRDTGKQCLPGMRMEIISEITDWVNSTGDGVQRVLWLSGPTGKGKSAIVHMIANWFNDVGGLGSCYCFDHQ
ncbi:hypothetical protein DFJ58DRAFT_688642 [Suillus subalutaceus]|uniref:uncharacterized protein n=1 Tax=Suillus subalutaceus TaxID=48586 RepID=UPI001B86BB43|nr:uncharacterized protein DFJ58DRAFT_688642 [Suillus subalutaceus]KAG1841568.1 hypothetical protein DFJ58DRAFT_688642 [Suillus subalutaceus]